MYEKNKQITKKREGDKFENDWSFQIHSYYFPIVYNPKLEAVATTISKFHFYPASFPQVITGWVFLNKSKKKFEKIPVTLTLPTEEFFPRIYRYFRGTSDDEGNIYYGVGYSPKIIKYDVLNKCTIEANLNFITIDTIEPKKSLEIADSDDNIRNSHEYNFIRYDKFNDLLWRISRIGTDENSPPIQINYPVGTIVLFDKNLNKLGEGIVPQYHKGPVIPFRGGLLLYDQMESDKKNEMIYSFFKFKLDTISRISFLEKFKQTISNRTETEESIQSYLHSIVSNNSYRNYLLIPVNNSCGPCLKKLLLYLKVNSKNLHKKNLAIILIANSNETIKTTISESNLNEYYNDYIFSDTKEGYKTSMPLWVNPKYIEIDIKNNIVLNENFNPSEMGSLFKILDSLQ